MSRVAGCWIRRPAVIVAFLLAGCGGDGATEPEIRISTDGGTVRSADGKVSLVIPAGALAQATVITVRPAAPAADPRLVTGAEYVFQPDGLQFAVPAKLTIRFDSVPAALADRAQFLWLHRRAGSGWVAIPGQPVDLTTRTVTGEITGFSSFAPAVSQLAQDLLTLGILFNDFVSNPAATILLDLLSAIGAVLQQQQDPAYQALAQPVLQTMLSSACVAYANAVNNARNTPINDWLLFSPLLRSIHYWEVVTTKLGSTGCPNVPLTLAQIHQLLIPQFISFYKARVRTTFDSDIDELIREARQLFQLRADLMRLGQPDFNLERDVQHPLMDAIRERAYGYCAADSRHDLLGKVREAARLGVARYSEGDILEDLQYCRTQLLSLIRSDDLVVDTVVALGGAFAVPGAAVKVATVPGVARGKITLGGEVRAFRCADGGFSPDQMVVTLGGVEVSRTGATNGWFFPPPGLDLDAEAILNTAGIDATQTATRELAILRESHGCGGAYVDAIGATKILAIRLEYPAVRVVYDSRGFNTPPANFWNQAVWAGSPAGERFLGTFVNTTLELSLTNLPNHGRVTVELDLYIIRSWDGNNTRNGPDVVNIQIDGSTVLNTTFSNVNGVADHNQAFPDAYPGGDNPAGTGAIAINTLGYFPKRPHHNADSTYRLRFVLPHTAGNVKLVIRTQNLDTEPDDEFWGVDNVRVIVR